MKKAVIMLVVVALLGGVLGSTPARAAEAVVVQMTIGSTKGTINMEQVVLDQAPLIENGRTLVPFRFIGEALGAQIGWNPVNKTVSYVLGKMNIVLTIGSTTAIVNGVKKTLDVAPKILSTGRTVVPVRFISEAIGAKVDWNATTRMVTVTMAAIAVVFSGQIKIGVSAAITGNFPLAGTRTQQGIQLAVKEINNKGGLLGKKVVLEVIDDTNSTTGAINAVNRLISDPDVVAVIGPHTSGNVMAVSDLYKNAKVPFLTGATSPKVDKLNNPYAFYIRPSDSISAKALVQYANKTLGFKKIGISYNTNDFGTGAKGVIEQYCKDNNLVFVSQGHNAGDKDFTGQIMKFKQANVDCVISWTDDAEQALTARQTYELGLNKPILCSAGITMAQVLDLVDAKWVENWYAETDFTINDTSAGIKTFAGKFEPMYGVQPELYAGSYYTAMRVLADAITRAGSADRAAITAALAKTKDFVGINSTLSCDDAHHMVHQVSIVQLHNKVAKVVELVSVNP